MEPYLVPHLTYQRVFGTVVQGAAGMNAEALQRARLLKKSVLDFSLRDLGKLRQLAPSAERERLDAHESAIRELERSFDQMPMAAGACGLGTPPPELKPFTDSAGNPKRPLNDMWLACAKSFDIQLPSLGNNDMITGPLDIMAS